jgi:surface antigen
MKKWIIFAMSICAIAAAVTAFVPFRTVKDVAAMPERQVGDSMDALNGVPVYYNGIVYTESYGSHYNDDGYYYGKKWQCVEYIKRYYYDKLHHTMPDVYGHAREFYDTALQPGELNTARNLYQYKNGGEVAPKPDDLLVFNNGKYGHVAIVSKVDKEEIEIVQQNILYKSRETLPLTCVKGLYTIGDDWQPVGWLRKE